MNFIYREVANECGYLMPLTFDTSLLFQDPDRAGKTRCYQSHSLVTDLVQALYPWGRLPILAVVMIIASL